jgi:hypothetical protein
MSKLMLQDGVDLTILQSIRIQAIKPTCESRCSFSLCAPDRVFVVHTVNLEPESSWLMVALCDDYVATKRDGIHAEGAKGDTENEQL